MVRDIQSAQNSWFKQFKHLIHNNRARKKEGIVVVEGMKEIQMALSSSYTLKYLIYCEQILSNQELSNELASIQLENVDFYNLTPVLYKEVAYHSLKASYTSSLRPHTLYCALLASVALVLKLGLLPL